MEFYCKRIEAEVNLNDCEDCSQFKTRREEGDLDEIGKKLGRDSFKLPCPSCYVEFYCKQFGKKVDLRECERCDRFKNCDQARVHRIEELGGVKLNPNLQMQLVTLWKDYPDRQKAFEDLPRYSQARKALVEVPKLASTLRKCLKELPSVIKYSLNNQCIGALPIPSNQVDIEKTIDTLQKLEFASDQILKSLPPDKGGRPSDLVLQRFINDLVDIFERATGKEAGKPYKYQSRKIDDDEKHYAGPFFRFVHAVLDTIDCPPSSNSSLGGSLTRILSTRKHNS